MSPTYKGAPQKYEHYVEYTVGSHPQYILEIERSPNPNKFRATKKGRGSGILVEFQFEKEDGEWKMIKATDNSM